RPEYRVRPARTDTLPVAGASAARDRLRSRARPTAGPHAFRRPSLRQTGPGEPLPAARARLSPGWIDRYGTAWAGRTGRSDRPQSWQTRWSQVRALNWPSNRERLAAAALGLFIRVAEAEPFVEPFPGVVELRAIQVGQAFRV